MFSDGVKLTKENYTQGAIWARNNNAQIIKKEDGYYIEVLPIVEKTLEEKNEEIRVLREQLYIQTSDKLKADYDEAAARGAENAEELKTTWLASKDKIREENPYIVPELEEPAKPSTKESEETPSSSASSPLEDAINSVLEK